MNCSRDQSWYVCTQNNAYLALPLLAYPPFASAFTQELEAKVALTEDYLRQHNLLQDGQDPSSSSGGSTSAEPHKPSAEDYLVGSQISDAEQSGTKLCYYWPMRAPAQITDWQAMIALWKHAFFNLLGVRRPNNTSVTLLALPAPLSRADHTAVSAIFFEQLNCPGLCIVETPLLSAYAAGALSATVVDVGWNGTNVCLILDCLVQHQAIVQCTIGARECTLWLAHLLRQDASIVNALSALSEHQQSAAPSGASQDDRLQDLLYELARQLVHGGHVDAFDEDDAGGASGGGQGAGAAGVDEEPELDVAAMLVEGKEKELIEEQERRKKAIQDAIAGKASEADVAAAITSEAGQAGGSTDPKAILVTFKGLKLKIGPSRHRWAEPFFKPAVLKNVARAQPSNISFPPFASGPVLGDPILGSTSRPAALSALDRTPIDYETALSLPECIAAAISQVIEIERRSQLWESLVITGAPTRVKGLTAAILRHCGSLVASNPSESAIQGGTIVPDEPNPLQARAVRALKVPDYFANFKERSDLAPFLGATIYAKVSHLWKVYCWY